MILHLITRLLSDAESIIKKLYSSFSAVMLGSEIILTARYLWWNSYSSSNSSKVTQEYLAISIGSIFEAGIFLSLNLASWFLCVSVLCAYLFATFSWNIMYAHYLVMSFSFLWKSWSSAMNALAISWSCIADFNAPLSTLLTSYPFNCSLSRPMCFWSSGLSNFVRSNDGSRYF